MAFTLLCQGIYANTGEGNTTGYDPSSWDNGLFQDTTVTYDVPESALAENADYTFEPMVATVPIGNIASPVGIFEPLNIDANTLPSFRLGNILRPNADHNKIDALDKQYLDIDAYIKYADDFEGSPLSFTEWKVNNLNDPQIQAQYKKASAISIFAGDGHGEIIVDAEGINNPPETVVYYHGNLKEVGRGPTYAGSMDDVLLTMTLYASNYTEFDSVKDVTQPFSGVVGDFIYGIGTSGLIAKAGKHEIYLTAEHCVDEFSEGDEFALMTPTPSEVFNAPEKLAKYTPWDKIKDFLAASSGSEYRINKAYTNYIKKYELEPQSPEILTVKRIETDPTADVAILSVDKPTGEAKAGDSIRITPISTFNPDVEDSLTYYARPIWKTDFNGKYYMWGDHTVSGSVLNANNNAAATSLKDYETDLSATHGWSGTPAFSKSEGDGFNPITGILVSGNTGRFSSNMGNNVNFVKPRAIRKSINGFIEPSLISFADEPDEATTLVNTYYELNTFAGILYDANFIVNAPDDTSYSDASYNVSPSPYFDIDQTDVNDWHKQGFNDEWQYTPVASTYNLDSAETFYELNEFTDIPIKFIDIPTNFTNIPIQ